MTKFCLKKLLRINDYEKRTKKWGMKEKVTFKNPIILYLYFVFLKIKTKKDEDSGNRSIFHYNHVKKFWFYWLIFFIIFLWCFTFFLWDKSNNPGSSFQWNFILRYFSRFHANLKHSNAVLNWARKIFKWFASGEIEYIFSD